MRIQANIEALNSYRNLTNINSALSKSLERLSSGLRINRAADDAAGLAISEKMRAQIRGLNQAIKDAQDGISLIQTAESSLHETHAILLRMRELSIQAANDTLTASDRMEIQGEIDQLTYEIDRIANTTEFNTKKLLDGTTSALASTDKLETKVFLRDGLRVEDRFGQKSIGGGNYRLDIRSAPGTSQIQKTDIFKVKHDMEVIYWSDVQGSEGELQVAFRPYNGVEDLTLILQDPYKGNGNQKVLPLFNEETGNLTIRVDLATDEEGRIISSVKEIHEAIMSEVMREGLGAENNVQVLRLENPTSGAFSISFDGDSTGFLDYSITEGELRNALESLDSIGSGNVSVSGENGVYTITFQGELGGRKVDQLQLTTYDTGWVGPEGTIGGPDTQNQTISFSQDGFAIDGYFSINLHDYSAIVEISSVNQTAQNIQQGLNRILSLGAANGGGVTVSGETIPNPEGPDETIFTITFQTDPEVEITDFVTNDFPWIADDESIATIVEGQPGAPLEDILVMNVREETQVLEAATTQLDEPGVVYTERGE